jgi:hypothetical protein
MTMPTTPENPEILAVKIVSALAWVPEAQREVVIANLNAAIRREVRKLL